MRMEKILRRVLAITNRTLAPNLPGRVRFSRKRSRRGRGVWHMAFFPAAWAWPHFFHQPFAGGGAKPVPPQPDRSEVQWPHLMAARGMADRQKGHSLVVGAALGAARSRLTTLTRKNTARETMRKSMTVLMNTP